MVFVVCANVLAVGLDGRAGVFCELPIRLTSVRFGAEAIRSLKKEEFDSVVSRWDLDDMTDGKFLKGLKTVKPSVPTIVLIKAGDQAGEIAARSAGASVVLSELVGNELLQEAVCEVLKLGRVHIRS